MDRRGFLKLLSGAAIGAVAAEAIPFNRVWSFPSQIRLFTPGEAMFFLDSADWNGNIYQFYGDVHRNGFEEMRMLHLASNLYKPFGAD